MKTWNPNRKLKVEIESNDLSNMYGYTIWHIINKDKKRAISRNSDGKDFDWMSEYDMQKLQSGKYKFSITAAQASEYYDYI